LAPKVSEAPFREGWFSFCNEGFDIAQ
jgi:hypothetical protein